MAKDIHAKPFDEGTLIKLELFKRYFREWLPVFTKSQYKRIEIYDFFAGEGTDVEGTYGSPLILLDEVKPYCKEFKNNSTCVEIHFNDFSSKKILKLDENVSQKLLECSGENNYVFCKGDNGKINCPFIIRHHNRDFQTLFATEYSKFKSAPLIPRFMLIDQYGIKHVTTEVFNQLTNLPKTDFIFFISSNHIRRFKEHPGFAAYLDSSKLDFSESRPVECHRVIFNYYKSLLNGKKYFLGQFSIKKNSGIHGVIFGSSHPFGLEKFLSAAWKIDPHTGETNYDIDEDHIRTGQLSLDLDGTGNQDKIKKLAAFENELINFLKTAQTNQSIYIFALERGVSISKTNEILSGLEKANKLLFSGDDRRKGAFYLDYNHVKKINIQSK
ncbi:MAG: three-Cys-motif partner protein TcmP [Paludibacter sp.]|nr:three-Cys-motif partner protein TcmP [Paludibacter sp.]